MLLYKAKLLTKQYNTRLNTGLIEAILNFENRVDAIRPNEKKNVECDLTNYNYIACS